MLGQDAGTRHFSTTCAVHTEDCEGVWLSDCHGSVVEHWLHKPGVLGSILGGCKPLFFASKHLNFLCITSNAPWQPNTYSLGTTTLTK